MICVAELRMMAGRASHVFVSRQDGVPKQQLAESRFIGAERIIRRRVHCPGKRRNDVLTLNFSERKKQQDRGRGQSGDRNKFFHALPVRFQKSGVFAVGSCTSSSVPYL